VPHGTGVIYPEKNLQIYCTTKQINDSIGRIVKLKKKREKETKFYELSQMS
jgi:hypothetical protein